MGNVIGIMGDSGSGKTTAMRNLDPKTTMYVDCDKKGLSWKGWKKDLNTKNENYIVTDETKMAKTIIKTVNKNEKYKNIRAIDY